MELHKNLYSTKQITGRCAANAGKAVNSCNVINLGIYQLLKYFTNPKADLLSTIFCTNGDSDS